MKSTGVLPIATCLALSSSAARSAPVSWAFTGSVYSVSGRNDPDTWPVQVGSPFSGVLTFDSSLPDNRPTDPNIGEYSIGQFGNITFQIGEISSDGYEFVRPPIPPNLLIFNDVLPIGSDEPIDELSIFANSSDAGDDASVYVQYYLRDQLAGMLVNDAIPANPPDPTSLCCTKEDAYFEVATFAFSARAHLETITVIPEPGSTLLVGLIGLLFIRRRM